MPDAVLEVFRGNQEAGAAKQYTVPIAPGMVVLDAMHYIQAHLAPDLAVRWNCKAGKCGSCSAEVNGKPRLTCKTRMDALPTDKPITVYPMKSFPVIKDLVTTSPGIIASTKRSRLSLPSQRPTGRCTRKTWIACRSFASALSASCARTSATSCATTQERRVRRPALLCSRSVIGNAPAG